MFRVLFFPFLQESYILLLKEEGRRRGAELTSLRSHLTEVTKSRGEVEASLALVKGGMAALKEDFARLLTRLASRKSEYVKKQEHNTCLGRSVLCS